MNFNLILIDVKKITLKPRTFKFKKLHKKRHILQFKNLNILKIGNSGLLILRPLRLVSSHIFRFKLLLKKAVKKFDITRRFFWFNTFPHYPLTRKPIGARMGKGKGKAKKWYVYVRGGINLVEFWNLRRGRSLYFIRQLSYRITAPSCPLFNNFSYLSFPFDSSNRIFLRTFW